MLKETFCAMGGDTEVVINNWEAGPPENLWTVLRNEGETLVSAICNRPESCSLRLYCTGKVTIGGDGLNAMKRPLIYEIYFDNPQTISKLHQEED